MAAPTYDYPALRKQFIADPKLSISELCRRNNIPPTSRMAVSRKAKSEGWLQDREKVQGRGLDRTMDLLADADARRALRVTEVENNVLDMTDEMVDQVRGRLKKMRPVTKLDDEGNEEIIDYVPDLIVRPDDLGKLFKGLAEMRSGGRAVAVPSPGNGGGNGGRSVNVNLPEGTELAVIARYVDKVRETGGPIDDFDAPGPDEATPALPSGAAGAGQGPV